MRLDHLLSKENIVYFCFCFVAWWVLVSIPLVAEFFCYRAWVLRVMAEFLFSGESKYHTWFYVRVGDQ